MKVKLRKGQRVFDYDDTDFSLYGEEEKILEDQHLRSYSVKWALLNGQLLPVEGSLTINYKHSKIHFSADTTPYAHGIEFGKLFIRDVEMQTTVWKDKDNFPLNIYNILMDVPESGVSVEETVEETVKETVEEEEKKKFTYPELKALRKDQQIKMLKDFGLPWPEIRDLRFEDDRIKKILKLQ